MVILRSLGVVLLLLGMACSSNGPIFIPADPGAQHALLYLYRPYDVSNLMLSPEIVVSQESVRLANGEYRALALSPGSYTLKLGAVEGYTEASETELVAEAGRVHYLRLDASMKMQTGVRYSAYQRGFRLTPVEAAVAQRQLSGLKDAAGQQAMECSSCSLEQPAEEEEATFSTDKTDNPFGR